MLDVKAIPEVSKFSGHIIPAPVAGEPLFERQWYLHGKNGPGKGSVAGINATEAWKFTKGDPDIVIAIIDVAFDLDHPSFSRPGKIVSPTDYASPTSNAFPSNYLLPHGTCCAGLALGESDKDGFSGVAQGCSFMPVRIPYEATNELLAEILEETSRNADVISCSWSFPPINAPLTSNIYDRLSRITSKGGKRKKGSVLCFSASNYNAPIQDFQNKEFLWLDESTDQFIRTNGPIVNGFAAHPDVITVAASTSENKKAIYSNWGKEIAVCAPSDNFHPFNKSFPVKGRRDIWTTGNSGNNDLIYTDQFGGTSASTALVAGVAALMLSVNPFLTAGDVKRILQDTADKIIDRQRDQLTGETKGEYLNGHSEWFGSGKVNAGNAVQKAKRMAETKLNANK